VVDLVTKLPKDGRITIIWSKRENDILYRAGKGCLHDLGIFHYGLTKERWTSKGLQGELEPSLIQELEKAGYDIKTLRIQIDKVRK